MVARVRVLAVGEQPVERLDHLGEARGARRRRDRLAAVDGRVPTDAAGADAEDEAAAGDVVERDRVLGERQRLAEVGGAHEGAEPDALGRAGEAGEPGDRAEPRPVAVVLPGEVVVGPEVVEPERLDVAGLGHRGGPRIRGDDADADPHGPSMAHPGPPGAGSSARFGMH